MSASLGGSPERPHRTTARAGLLTAALAALAFTLPARAVHAADPDGAARACADEVAPPARIVDLNSADESALLELPGIGPARARAIIAYRAAHGGFRSLSQLLNIKGIGRALLRRLRPQLTIADAPGTG